MRLDEVMSPQELEEINWKKIGTGVAAAGLAGAMALGSAGTKADDGSNQMGMSWNDMGDKVEIVQAKTDTYKKLFTMQANRSGKEITPTLQKIINVKAQEKALADYNAEFKKSPAKAKNPGNDGTGSYSRSIGGDW
jgi:hypothetical protein